MTTPAPLTPEDSNLQDFAFMPLDVARLRDSDLAANESPTACWAAVQLWAASWHQVPAASIPDDDKWMAKQTGYGRMVKDWLKIKEGAMRGWIKCSDGRLYHPVVSEKANEAWLAKLAQRWKTECARIKKHNDRHECNIERPTYDDWFAAGCPVGQPLPVPRDKAICPDTVPKETGSKGQGEGEGQGQGDLNKDTVAKATGGEPPVGPVIPLDVGLPKVKKPKVTDPNEIIFGYGVPLLVTAGTAEKQARSFLGGLRKNHGDSVLIDTLRQCISAKPLQPLEWLAAALPPPSSTPKPNAQDALEASNAAAAQRFLNSGNPHAAQ
jgi:hypothetical protein